MNSDSQSGQIKIETARLDMICCNIAILEAFFKGNAALGSFLQVNVPENWTEYGEAAFRHTHDRIVKGNAKIQWLTYLPVLRKTKTIIGCCGFKGAPKKGVVEIGYEVAVDFRGWGLGTEIALGLVNKAFESPEVKIVQAHTLPVANASTVILEKCGLVKVEDVDDPEDGRLWRWEVRKEKMG
jgi:RimJ/RimL family protein N-acetyltransferase